VMCAPQSVTERKEKNEIRALNYKLKGTGSEISEGKDLRI